MKPFLSFLKIQIGWVEEMSDIVASIGNSVLQHGKYNDRVYLMKLARNDLSDIIYRLDELANSKGYSKIVAKVPEFARSRFIENGYIQEAHIPTFYYKSESVYFMGKFYSEERKFNKQIEKVHDVLEKSNLKQDDSNEVKVKEAFECRIITTSQISKLINVFKIVFETYPFPIYDPEYILKTMNDNVVYFGIWEASKLIGVSSADIDIEAKNVEMTDFAVLPDYRGEGLANNLLSNMEEEMRKRDIKVVYTIARALSYGMNITFSKAGYTYSGTLVNNTNICGNYESMNIWYKCL